MSGSEDEDVGPSVDSLDPEERIRARRERIQKRIEAQRRQLENYLLILLSRCFFDRSRFRNFDGHV